MKNSGFDLSFTQDAAWIKNREEIWEKQEEQLSEFCTRKGLNQIKSYFMTGRLPKGLKLNQQDYINFFPEISVVSIDYICKFIVDDNSDEAYRAVQGYLASGIDYAYWMSPDAKLELFKYCFGTYFGERASFPFLISKDQTIKNNLITANDFFAYSTNPYFFLDKVDYPPSLWCENLDFLFSFISQVDVRFFHIEFYSMSEKIIGTMQRIRPNQGRFRKLLLASLDPPRNLIDGVYSDIWGRYFNELSERMNNLTNEPDELKALWMSIKQQVIL